MYGRIQITDLLRQVHGQEKTPALWEEIAGGKRADICKGGAMSDSNVPHWMGDFTQISEKSVSTELQGVKNVQC